MFNFTYFSKMKWLGGLPSLVMLMVIITVTTAQNVLLGTVTPLPF